MKRLENEQAIINLLGKNDTLKFVFATDGVLTYETAIPKLIEDQAVHFKLEVFYEILDSFFCYERVSDVVTRKKVFRLESISMDGQTKELYKKKYDEQ